MRKMMISFTAGIILGVLYAPARGEKTRRKLANIGTDIKEGWNNITDSVTDRIDSIREGVNNIADKTIDKVEGAQFTVDDRAGYL